MRSPTRVRRPHKAGVLSLLLAATLAAAPLAAKPALAEASAALDAYLATVYPPNEPGAAVLVAKDGEVLLRKGYGLANLELSVPNRPETVFRIGSVTKQITAGALMLLVQEGKVRLEDDFTRYLPDYPKPASPITVEQLLTHTSGIVSYTSLPEWQANMRQDLPTDKLVAAFKDKPLQFAPGEDWAYNNSAYFLTGLIIEKVSGLSYEQFVEERIFAPLGMKSSRYDHSSEIVPLRAAGYDKTDAAYENTQFLSTTQPYAAGALLSTVDDLHFWNLALASGKLLTPASVAKIETPTRLKSGQSARYGYGWSVIDLAGLHIVEHGGDINGFSSHNLRVPAENLDVIVLSNNTGATRPGTVALQLALRALGLPTEKPKPAVLPAATLDEYVGVYRIDDEDRRIVRRTGDHLTIERTGGSRTELYPSARDVFFYPNGDSELRFLRDAAGKVTAQEYTPRFGPIRVSEKTADPVPAEKQAVRVDPKVFDAYLGTYELTPALSIVVSRDGDRLIGSPTGQKPVELHPLSESRFFLKEVDAEIEFVRDDKGTVGKLVLYQGGELEGKRVK